MKSAAPGWRRATSATALAASTPDDKAVGHLFKELGPRFKSRPGGYLRILKTGFRAGDSAPMAIVQLLDQPEKTPEKKEPRTTA